MKRSLRTFFLATFAAAFGASAFAEVSQMQAVVTKATGKAEVKSGSSWVPLEVGSKLEKGAVIQTGFKSEVVLEIKGSTLTVAPLSRLTLEQLVEKDNKDETRVFLDTGSLRSNVKKTDDRAVGFKVRSPVATASVRGTELAVTNRFRSTDVKTLSGTVAVWKSEADGAEVASESEDEAPAVLPGAGASAQDIAGDGAPKNAFTVTRGQTAGFSAGGHTAPPQSNAAKAAFALNGGTQSAAAGERESTAPAAPPQSRPSPAAGPEGGKADSSASKGSISVTVQWGD